MSNLKSILEAAKANPDRAIFVSRSGADPKQRELAIWISQRLEKHNYIVILQDVHFMHADFMLAMNRALESGARVLALMSREYNESEYCLKEATTALNDPMNSNRQLVILKIDDFSPAGLFRNIDRVDFRQAWKSWNEPLMESLIIQALKFGEASRNVKSPSIPLGAETRANSKVVQTKTGSNSESYMSASIPTIEGKTFRQFLHQIDLSSVKRVMVFATVGEVTIRQLCTVLKARASFVGKRIVDVHVLLSSSAQSSAKRAQSIRSTVEALRGFAAAVPCYKVKVRTFASPAIFRGAIVEHDGSEYGGYFAYYYWGAENVLSNPLFADDHGLLIEASDKTSPMVLIFRSWFDHFWGCGNVNTILFDFDDTIFDTTEAQVEGWVHAIKYVLKEGAASASLFSSELADAIQNGTDLKPLIKDIFLREQTADLIIRRILPFEFPEYIRKLLHQHRMEVRKRITITKSDPINAIAQDIRHLHQKYRLIIVSATLEEIIEEVLGRPEHNLRHLFSYVFGKAAEEFDAKWEGVEGKSQRFVRISAMLGVPLDRMVFVGDSDADYRAASQLGIQFIENNYCAIKNGRTTLLRDGARAQHTISGSIPGELIACIEKIERNFGVTSR